MMTRNPSYSRIVVVWLVLLAFIGLSIVPSIAHARKDMTIATEGDPEDGLGATSGGSGEVFGGNEGVEPTPIFRFEFSIFNADHSLIPLVGTIYPIPTLWFFVTYHDSEIPLFEYPWRQAK